MAFHLVFVRTGNYDALAGVILCVTGCEAIFANLGQFTPNSIRVGFVFAYVSLVFQYLGQGARYDYSRSNIVPSRNYADSFMVSPYLGS